MSCDRFAEAPHHLPEKQLTGRNRLAGFETQICGLESFRAAVDAICETAFCIGSPSRSFARARGPRRLPS